MAVWIFAAVTGILFVNFPGQFTGPLGDLAAGVDLSIPVSIGLAGVLYPLALWFFPEPADAFGPAGPRFVRAAVAKDVPITAEEPAERVVVKVG